MAATIAVIGAGAMGRGIAQLAATAGDSVLLADLSAEARESACRAVAAQWARGVERGRMSAADAAAAEVRLRPVESLQELAGAALVVEAVVERLETKQRLFAELEGIVGPGTVLATNTSSLSVTAIAAACRDPGRVAGFHFFNPVPLMRVVEVVDGLLTRPETADRLVETARRWGHRPVRVADTPGFLVNHAARALVTEGLRIVEEGVADFAAIDRVMREAAGFRMGPFELMDLTGLDVSHPVMEEIYAAFHQEPRHRPSALTARRVAAGLLGRKTGRGFYAYAEGAPVQPPEPPTPALSDPYPVWLAPGRAAERLAGLGLPLDTGEQPGEASLCLVAPLGEDAGTAALGAGLDPQRTVAVDTLLDLGRRRTLMPTSITAPAFLGAAHALLAADGVPATVIHDSPGFIAQRVLAMIVNTACAIAQQRIAAPDDIDAGVRLGLGYPEGPLALGDSIGPATILTILEAIQAATGDPRYRAAPWLRRRARLGVSLLTPEA